MQAKAGRPKERQGDYERITLEVRRDLLEYLDSKPGSRRDTIERLVEKDTKIMAGLTHEQIEAWANSMLDEATDDVHEQSMEITPESLSAFFEKEYELSLTPEEAKAWLVRQNWYHDGR